MSDLDGVLKHYGVLGMKWGVRKDKPRMSKSTTPSQNTSKKTSLTRNVINSKKRELSTINKSRVKNMDKLTTKEIRAQANRLRLENDLKRLSKKPSVGTNKDKKDYLRRDKMSDAELSRKVNRLQAKDTFKKESKKANQDHIKLGKQVVSFAAPMVLGYVTANAPDIAKKFKDMNTPANREMISKLAKNVLK